MCRRKGEVPVPVASNTGRLNVRICDGVVSVGEECRRVAQRLAETDPPRPLRELPRVGSWWYEACYVEETVQGLLGDVLTAVRDEFLETNDLLVKSTVVR